jgi:hypothetical protein
MPSQNGAGLGNGGHFRQRMLAELLADRWQRPALAVGQSPTTRNPVPEDAIFSHQTLVPRSNF